LGGRGGQDKNLSKYKYYRQTVVFSNIVKVPWQKLGVTSHIQRKVFETQLIKYM